MGERPGRKKTMKKRKAIVHQACGYAAVVEKATAEAACCHAGALRLELAFIEPYVQQNNVP